MQIAHINNHLRRPKGITELDPNAKPAENLLKRNFNADKPYKKCVTDITDEPYVNNLMTLGLIQIMNSAGGRCHDNAKCESMWSRMNVELFYDRYDTRKMTKEELKKLIWRYYMGYWNNRRICTANGGLPPILKEQQYYDSITNKDKQYDLYVI